MYVSLKFTSSTACVQAATNKMALLFLSICTAPKLKQFKRLSRSLLYQACKASLAPTLVGR